MHAVVLGQGVRLWDGLEGLEKDYQVEATSSPSGVPHVTFSRGKSDFDGTQKSSRIRNGQWAALQVSDLPYDLAFLVDREPAARPLWWRCARGCVTEVAAVGRRDPAPVPASGG
jgi:hypothetical protein